MIPVTDLEVYKYNISDISLMSPKWVEPITIVSSTMVNRLTIINNYDGSVVPQFKLDCQVPYDIYYAVLSGSSNLTATFTISMANLGKMSSVRQMAEQSDRSINIDLFSREYCRCKLRAIDNGYLYSGDIAIDSVDEIGMAEKVHGGKEEYRISLLLFDSDKLVKYRKNRSFIVNGNLNDALYELMDSRGIEDLIMEGTDAVERSDYYTPYGDLGKNLESLNNYYGLYDYEYLFYMGIERSYLISKGNLGKVTELGELSTVNIYVERQDDAENNDIQYGCFKDEINKAYILGTTDVQIDNTDSMVEYASGSIITSVIGGDKKKYTDTIGTENIEISNMFMNRKKHQQFVHGLKEAKRLLGVNFKNIDIGIITPNKKYVIIANQKYYEQEYDISGEYRLKANTIFLSNDGNGSFGLSTTLSLVKIK